ncbi:hypothetical protein GCM10023196_040020 [Actinoallomurus vinaceus]|uniref:Uncharacterized protein n=1 Tax=Actinoallomurus vinaceus TaxID=1080074 RepID=A0ABP8UA57_9ACTN
MTTVTLADAAPLARLLVTACSSAVRPVKSGMSAGNWAGAGQGDRRGSPGGVLAESSMETVEAGGRGALTLSVSVIVLRAEG